MIFRNKWFMNKDRHVNNVEIRISYSKTFNCRLYRKFVKKSFAQNEVNSTPRLYLFEKCVFFFFHSYLSSFRINSIFISPNNIAKIILKKKKQWRYSWILTNLNKVFKNRNLVINDFTWLFRITESVQTCNLFLSLQINRRLFPREGCQVDARGSRSNVSDSTNFNSIFSADAQFFSNGRTNSTHASLLTSENAQKQIQNAKSNQMNVSLPYLGLLNGPLFRRFSIRQVGLFGALLVAVSLYFTSISDSFVTYVLSFSVLYGKLGLNTFSSLHHIYAEHW